MKPQNCKERHSSKSEDFKGAAKFSVYYFGEQSDFVFDYS